MSTGSIAQPTRPRRTFHAAVCAVLLSLGVGAGAAGCNPDEPFAAKPAADSSGAADRATQTHADVNTSAVPGVPPESAPQANPPKEDAPDLPLPPPLLFERTPPPPLQTGWAILEEHADSAKRAWVEGEVAGGDRLTINTENLRRFTLDLTRIRLNWTKRIVLRMDGFNSQLTRKHWPKLHFVRTSSGSWDVVDD